MKHALILVLLGAGIPATATEPIPPTYFASDSRKSITEVLDEIRQKTGFPIQLNSKDTQILIDPFPKTSFWGVLERIAEKTNSHLEPVGQNRALVFQIGRSRSASSLDGAFRFVPAAVTARTDLTTGRSDTTLSIHVGWEPRFPVFRIDAQPKITAATDDLGNKLSVTSASVKSAVTGYHHTADVRINGLTRNAKALAVFEGEFQVTASPKMLAMEWTDLTTVPASKTIDGVKATITKILKRDTVWEIAMTVDYPEDPPNFESFESWTNRNRIRIFAPDGKEVGQPENFELNTLGRVIRAAYRYSFNQVDWKNRSGWKVIYETPAPLREFPVRFQFKDIPLP